jgi:hypothetical protein
MDDSRRIDRAEPDADPPFEKVAPGKRANAGIKDRPFASGSSGAFIDRIVKLIYRFG